MTDLPVVPLPGSTIWRSAYEWGATLNDAFPQQGADDFTCALSYNDSGPTTDQKITDLVMVREGENDERSWIWRVVFEGGEVWRMEAWCDYTGWDCQSGNEWTKLS